MGVSLGSDTPQFATAEYAHIPGTERCRICSSLISGEYFRVNGQMACGKCAGEARDGQPSDSHAAFARALLMGAGAAVLGLILYSTFAIVTGWTIGYLALAVGWLVAKGMMKGSNGVGGRRYQITAVLLTYAAISLATIPVIISQVVKDSRAKTHQSQQAGTTADSKTNGQQASTQPDGQKKHVSLGAALAQLALIGLASPFLELAEPGSGILGLLILFVGLSIAFRMTAAKPLDVDGPYGVTA
ncbi:MAG TPA: hypothetical protein VHD85_18715 [Terracidiphilus sp.]|nr:hypothetical protein [Terracidiphilus sp.]